MTESICSTEARVLAIVQMEQESKLSTLKKTKKKGIEGRSMIEPGAGPKWINWKQKSFVIQPHQYIRAENLKLLTVELYYLVGDESFCNI
jgi:hypothetical protein